MLKLLTGILAGIAIGILIAPDKGTNTRQRLADLKEKGRDLLEGASDRIQSAKEEASSFLSNSEGNTPTFTTDTANAWNS